jgi:hypothetical protein
MAATIPPGYQNLGRSKDGNGDVWGKNIKIKGKDFQVVVNPTTQQKWLYEKDLYGNGKPLFTITTDSPAGFARDRYANGELVPELQDNFSYFERKSALEAAGLNGNLLRDQLQKETRWANIEKTQPAPTPPPAPKNPENGPQETGDAGGGTPPASNFDSSLFKDLTGEFVDKKEKEKYSLWKLKYPVDMSDLQDRIIITQIQYVPGLNVSGETNTDSVISGESRFNESRNSKEKIIGNVTLPMPNDISESNSVGWGEDSLGNFAASVMPGLIGGVAGVTEGDLSALTTSAESAIKSAMNGKTRFKQYMQSSIAASILKKFNINVNPEAYITRATGSAINPNMELLFSGPKLRQFGFSFKMTPRSTDEAKAIRGIIQFFKKGMAPRRSTNPELSFFLGTPNVFQINFKSGNNQLNSIGRIKTCALVSFNANYTADGFYAAYKDAAAGGSQPISITIQMGFSELTPVFSDEFDLDDDNVVIGPSVFNSDYGIKVNSAEDNSNQPDLGQNPTQARLNAQREAALRQAGSTTPNIPGNAL